MQIGLLHGPDKPRAGQAMLGTSNILLNKARSAGSRLFLARHIGPPGSPIELESPFTELVPELVLRGDEVILKKNAPTSLQRQT